MFIWLWTTVIEDEYNRLNIMLKYSLSLLHHHSSVLVPQVPYSLTKLVAKTGERFSHFWTFFHHLPSSQKDNSFVNSFAMAGFDKSWEAVTGLIFFRKNCSGKTSTEILNSSLAFKTTSKSVGSYKTKLPWWKWILEIMISIVKLNDFIWILSSGFLPRPSWFSIFVWWEYPSISKGLYWER